MAYKRYTNGEVIHKYRHAFAAYQDAWIHVDEMMREAIGQRNKGTFSDVYPNVVLVDGIYRAQLNRTLGKQALVR